MDHDPEQLSTLRIRDLQWCPLPFLGHLTYRGTMARLPNQA